MCKHLRIWLFVLLGTLFTSSTLLAEGLITMTTSRTVGGIITLRIDANGDITIEGVKETLQTEDRVVYCTLTSQTITIRGDVTELDCSDNQLTSLDVSKNTSLTDLDCFNNQLMSLDVSKNTALTTLYCFDNQLTSLNVSKNRALTTLSCGGNQLTSLDLSKNTALTELNCPDNQLTSLDVSKNTALESLECSINQLTSLNISGCARLDALYCFSNCINGEAMTKLVNSLPNRKGMSSGSLWVVSRSSKKGDKNRCSVADVTTARKKNWEVQQ
ncbi:hypothetical protein [uncultured Porphyromonas sp.]|uniref:leucine-rich repeat domain-containing protein n=1 Tax=uncultured Porphyromonas sp. TaxID=159274 RepID=UPI00262A9867|nr:hypothetical protein [uncultured Porphyromonas sp.]